MSKSRALVPAAEKPAALIELSSNAQKYLALSLADNTLIAYARCWRDFEAFCRKPRIRPLPCSPQIVIDYIVWLAELGLAVSTIDQRVAAIAYFHRAREFDDPTAPALVKQILSGIRRERAARGIHEKQATPLLREDLFHLAIALPDTLTGIRDRALIFTAFALARRESEIAALVVSDLKFLGSAREPNALQVRIRKSKTDQEGVGRTKRIPRLSELNELICPVRAMRLWLDEAHITSGAVFRKVDRHGKVWTRGINPRTVEMIVSRSMKMIGKEGHYTGHSPRAGFTSQAGDDGVPIQQIMDVTDHVAIQSALRYFRNQGTTTPLAIATALGD